jgi:hypothetical protein
MKYSKGVSWTDDTRIPFVDKETINFDRPRIREKKEWVYELGTTWENPDVKEYNTQGRFTPNLLVCDDMLNDGRITKTTASKGHIRKGNVLGDTRTPVAAGQFGDGAWIEGTNINDKGSSSRFYDLDLWFNKVIDEIR